MLVARIYFLKTGMVELFGFWYWDPPKVPWTEKGMNFFGMDLLANKCAQVRVFGTSDQINDLFILTLSTNLDDGPYHFTKRGESVLEMGPGEGAVWVDLADPKPNFVPISSIVEVQEDEKTIFQQLKAGEDLITLNLHPSFKLKFPGIE
jgi:hypothetical protein